MVSEEFVFYHLERRLDDHDYRLRELSADIKDLNVAVDLVEDDLEEKYRKLMEEIRQLKAEYEKVGRELDELGEKYAEIKAGLERLERLLNEG